MAEGEDKDGGYDCDLIEEPPDDLICPICLLPPRKPHLISCCGTKLCHSCVDKVKQAGDPCPCCREEKYDIMIDRKVERQVLDLKVCCKNKSNGCPWSGELRDLEKHTESCSYAKLLEEKNKIIEKQAAETLNDENEQLKKQPREMMNEKTLATALVPVLTPFDGSQLMKKCPKCGCEVLFFDHNGQLYCYFCGNRVH